MKTISLLFGLLLISVSISAQNSALQKNTQWLEKNLNALVINDSDDDKNDPKPEFKFTNSQMLMNVQSKDEKFSIGIHLSWLLKDIQKVSYKKEKDGNYALVLNVPADRMKMDMGFGDDNSVSGSFNIKEDEKDKKDDDHTSFSLSTKDEKLVQEMVRKFESVMVECRK